MAAKKSVKTTKPKGIPFAVSFTFNVEPEPGDTDASIIEDFRGDIPNMLGYPVRDFKMVRVEHEAVEKPSKVVPLRVPIETPAGKTCSRCNGGGQDPEVAGCRCDCCGGTGIEE